MFSKLEDLIVRISLGFRTASYASNSCLSEANFYDKKAHLYEIVNDDVMQSNEVNFTIKPSGTDGTI